MFVKNDAAVREALDRWIDIWGPGRREEINDAIMIAPPMTHIEQMAFFAMHSEFETGTGEYQIIPQKKLGPYRVDFLFRARKNMRRKVQVVIECDGHDFHERTKEQAMKDRWRDRDLQNNGYVVHRHTGAEIYKTRGRCVNGWLRDIVQRNRKMAK